jgi:hypothetical protein
VIRSETTPGPSGDALALATRVGERRGEPEDDEQRQRRGVERAPVVGGLRVQDELVARRDLVEPRQGDARVRGQVHGVPPLVAHPPPHDRDRAPGDRDEERRPDSRRDHPRVDVSPEHRRDLAGERQLVEQRVAPDGEHDVREDEVDAGMPVPPVPDGEPVEADHPLDHGDPREQQHLDQRQVGAEQAGEPSEAREQVPRPGEVVEVAAVRPEPDDDAGVGEHDEPYDGRCERTAGSGTGEGRRLATRGGEHGSSRERVGIRGAGHREREAAATESGL